MQVKDVEKTTLISFSFYDSIINLSFYNSTLIYWFFLNADIVHETSIAILLGFF